MGNIPGRKDGAIWLQYGMERVAKEQMKNKTGPFAPEMQDPPKKKVKKEEEK